MFIGILCLGWLGEAAITGKLASNMRKIMFMSGFVILKLTNKRCYVDMMIVYLLIHYRYQSNLIFQSDYLCAVLCSTFSVQIVPNRTSILFVVLVDS